MDPKVLKARLKKLDEYQKSLLRFKNIKLDKYLYDDDVQTIVERKVQLSIQTCIDIANYIIAREGLRIPDEEENIFLVLAQESFINHDLGQRMKGMVNFRNILVHEYLEIDNELVHRHLTRNLADFDQFAKSIIDYLEEPRDQSCAQ
jgi:uncharacterized protein YutE (UPF0331/DUF86 family)